MSPTAKQSATHVGWYELVGEDAHAAQPGQTMSLHTERGDQSRAGFTTLIHDGTSARPSTSGEARTYLVIAVVNEDRLACVSPGDDHPVLPEAEVAAVHEANQASWQISTEQPQPLVIGLFIRDVAGVPSRNSWLPPLRRPSRAPETRLQMRRGCNGTSGGTRPRWKEIRRTERSGPLTSAPGGPHPTSSPFTRRLNSRRSSLPTSATPSGGATTAIKSMARPCKAALARCSRQGLSEAWNGPWPDSAAVPPANHRNPSPGKAVLAVAS